MFFWPSFWSGDIVCSHDFFRFTKVVPNGKRPTIIAIMLNLNHLNHCVCTFIRPSVVRPSVRPSIHFFSFSDGACPELLSQGGCNSSCTVLDCHTLLLWCPNQDSPNVSRDLIFSGQIENFGDFISGDSPIPDCLLHNMRHFNKVDEIFKPFLPLPKSIPRKSQLMIN